MRKNKGFYCAGISLLLVAMAANAQTTTYQPPVFTDADRIQKIQAVIPVLEKMYKDQAEKTHYPGLAFGVVVDGKLVDAAGFGYADITKKNPATLQSAFRIASMTKSFTAMAILQLRDVGKLRLDDAVCLYVPELKNVSYLTTDAAPITVRQLLTHAAGFPEDNPWGDRQLADSDADLSNLLTGGVSFSNVPDVAYEYSNLGFAILGRIVTTVSHQPYQQYITENILKPLGMTHTYWEWEKVPAALLAHGYRWLNETWKEEKLEHDGAYGAMGGLITTIEDFAKYMQLHMKAWPPRNEKESPVLKRSSLREMQHPWNINAFLPDYKFPDGRVCGLLTAYAYGLRWARNCNGQIMVGHSGGLPGFGSEWRFSPEYGIGVVSFSNLTYGGTGTINQRVLDTLITLAGLKPRLLPASQILEQRKSELVKLLPDWKADEKSSIFAENFFSDYLIDSMRKEAVTLFAGAGKIMHIGAVIPLNNLRGLFVLEGSQKNIEISFTLTPENPALVQEYHIREVKKD